jgi:hypothetical protein
MPAVFERHRAASRPRPIVTDGGSTKQDVIAAARSALGAKFAQFVPGIRSRDRAYRRPRPLSRAVPQSQGRADAGAETDRGGNARPRDVGGDRRDR